MRDNDQRSRPTRGERRETRGTQRRRTGAAAAHRHTQRHTQRGAAGGCGIIDETDAITFVLRISWRHGRDRLLAATRRVAPRTLRARAAAATGAVARRVADLAAVARGDHALRARIRRTAQMRVVFEVAGVRLADARGQDAGEVVERGGDDHELRADVAEAAGHRSGEFIQVQRQTLQGVLRDAGGQGAGQLVVVQVQETGADVAQRRGDGAAQRIVIQQQRRQ